MVFGTSIKTIVFDLDGTLHDLNVNWESVRNKLLVDKNFKIQEYIDRSDYKQKSVIYSILDEAERKGFGGGFNPKVIKILEDLTRDYTLIIFSRNSEKIIAEYLARASTLLSEQVLVVGRNIDSAPKPDVSNLLERHNIGKNSVVVGDTYHDIEVAESLSTPCIIVRNKRNDFTPKGANYYVNSLEEAIELITGRIYE